MEFLKSYFITGFGAILFMTAGSCIPDPDNLRLLDDLVVETNYDTLSNFNSFSTFSIPTDTIGFFSNSDPGDTLLTAAESDFVRPIISRIREKTLEAGLTQVAVKDNPDIGISVFVVNNYNLFTQVYYPNYYSGYYGYGSYYSYPIINTYARNTGSLVIEWVDLKNKLPGNKVKVVWKAVLGDVYSTVDLIPQTERGIDQAFLQSPYLKSE